MNKTGENQKIIKQAMKILPKDWRPLLVSADKAGWVLKNTRKGVMAYPPNKQHAPICVHLTPSAGRGLRNKSSEFKRAGLIV